MLLVCVIFLKGYHDCAWALSPREQAVHELHQEDQIVLP